MTPIYQNYNNNIQKFFHISCYKMFVNVLNIVNRLRFTLIVPFYLPCGEESKTCHLDSFQNSNHFHRFLYDKCHYSTASWSLYYNSEVIELFKQSFLSTLTSSSFHTDSKSSLLIYSAFFCWIKSLSPILVSFQKP